MTTTFRIPHRELRPGLKRYEDGDRAPAWDLYLDGELIASEIVSETQAQLELDLAAWYALFGDAALAADAPITEEALGLALAVFNRCFSVLKVQEKARIALKDIISAGIYTITTGGDLSVLASTGRGKTSYTVSATQTPRDEHGDAYAVTMACECKDFYARGHEHGGVCKHVAARLLLYLAQRGVAYLKHLRDALDTSESPPLASTPAATLAALQQALDPQPPLATDETTAEETSTLAFVELDATDLLAALRLAQRSGMPVTIRAEHGILHLVAGTTELAIPGLDGDSVAAAHVDAETFASLYEQLRPVAKRVGTIAVFVEPSDGTVILGGRSETEFSALIQGTPISIPPQVTQPTSTLELPSTLLPSASTDTPALDALLELFNLLEQHEPEWYLKRHYRIALEALQLAGQLAA